MTLHRAATLQTTTLWILRHGQALHNPRAEAARSAGCSKAEFLEWMRRDDALDAPLTALGIEQARSVQLLPLVVVPDVVIASPLSRALQTADVACSPASISSSTRRIAYEGFREINGWLLNAKRRSKTELQSLFPAWDFDDLQTEHDVLWEPTVLEDERACGERGHQGLLWIARTFQDASSVLLVAHGGILSYTMQLQPHVMVRDERSEEQQERAVTARFSNCELRRYRLQVEQDVVTLTEVDLDS